MDNNTYEIYEVQYKGIPIYIGSGEQDQRHKQLILVIRLVTMKS